jgi:hypothetical protein
MSRRGDSAPATRREPEAGETASGNVETGPRAPRRVVVIGEFNSGKTELVNALLGSPVLCASFITRTAVPTAVGFAAKPYVSAEIANRKRIRLASDGLDRTPPEDSRWLHVGLPLERLRALRLIDTPGLGGGDDGGDERVLRICRRADTLVWCTPAMQAWKASEERAWLTLPRGVRARGILAVTFADAIASSADRDRLMARLQAQAGGYFGGVALASELGTLLASLSGRVTQPFANRRGRGLNGDGAR